MAKSGTIEGSVANGNYKLRIVWTATQSLIANTSTITAKLYLVQNASWSLNIGDRSSIYNSCTIDGNKYAFSTKSINNSGGSTTLLSTVTHTVSHNADGTRTANIAGVFGIRATISGTYYASISASATVTLDTIPRTSTVTASASSLAIGQTLTLTISRATSTFTHSLRYSLAGTSGAIATGVETSYAWALPMSLCNALPSSTSGNLIIYCDTYSGTTLVGTKSVSVTANVPASVVPTITGATIAEGGNGVPEGWGVYLAGISQLRVSVAASGVYGSTIAGYTCKVNGASYTAQTFTTGALTGDGEQVLTVTVKDTRGRSATKTYNYTVVPYSRPSIMAFTAKRVDVDGNDNDEGEIVSVSVAAQIATVNGKNSGTLTIAYKTAIEAGWTTVGTYLVTSAIDHTLTVEGMSIDSAFDFSATLTDALHTSTLTTDVPTATPTMDFKANGRGVAIGKVSEYDLFECAMPALFYDTIRVGSNRLSPLVAMTVHRDNTNQNLAATDTYEQIKFTGTTALGSGLSLDASGGVVIGEGVTTVRISGQICFGAQVNSTKVAAVWVEGSNTHLARTQAYVTTANPQTIVFAPKYVNVTPGSVLSLRAYGQQGDVVYGGTMQTYFTVEAVG